MILGDKPLISEVVLSHTPPGAYVLAEVDDGMLPNTRNDDQLRKYYV
jgi:hypothetical protein